LLWSLSLDFRTASDDQESSYSADGVKPQGDR
jgi:hypothetical protein